MTTVTQSSKAINWRPAVLGALIFAGIIAATAAWARPADLNLSLDRVGDQSVCRVRIQSRENPIPLSQMHQWTIHVANTEGLPVAGAVIAVDGGMPEHGHGLPTAPRVTAAGLPGDYLISGMKFSMTGWWVLKLAIASPDGHSDHITFNIVL